MGPAQVTWNTFEGEVLDGYCNGTSMVEGEADYDYSGGQDYEGSGGEMIIMELAHLHRVSTSFSNFFCPTSSN